MTQGSRITIRSVVSKITLICNLLYNSKLWTQFGDNNLKILPQFFWKKNCILNFKVKFGFGFLIKMQHFHCVNWIWFYWNWKPYVWMSVFFCFSCIWLFSSWMILNRFFLVDIRKLGLHLQWERRASSCESVPEKIK